MRKLSIFLVACAAAFSVSLVPAQAGLSKAPKCKACGMTLSTKKTKATPVAVKIKGKTYYCCAGCDMSKIADK